MPESNKIPVYGPRVFQREDNRFLAFYAQTVWDMDEFDRLCPPPENPHVFYARDETGKGSKQTDWEHPEYLHAEKMRDKARWGYVFLKTLEPSVLAYMVDVEVEKPKLDDEGKEVLGEDGKPVMEKVIEPRGRTEPLTIPGCSLKDPTTWAKAEDNLKSILGHYEFNQIYAFVHDANSISQAKLEDNLESFFQIMAQHTADTSRSIGPSSTSDSERANDSE